MSGAIEIVPVGGLPELSAGDPLGAMIVEALRATGARLGPSDAIAVAQKAVSKIEGRIRALAAVEPDERSRDFAAELDKDPRLVQLILDESRAVIRAERDILIVETRSGLVCANAGIDASNVPVDGHVTLLPVDPDASARRLRAAVRDSTGVAPAVVVTDSFGRPWRLGQSDVAIGCAGLEPLDDWRGRSDRAGRRLAATAIAIADEVAAAADLARDKTSAIPVTLVRGLGRHVTAQDGPGAATLRRPAADDLFR